MKRTFVILTSCLLLGGIAMLSADNYVDDAYYWPGVKRTPTVSMQQSAGTTGSTDKTSSSSSPTSTGLNACTTTPNNQSQTIPEQALQQTAAPKEKIQFIQVTDTVVKAVIRK